MEISDCFRFKSPSSILVVGPSSCGKTVFVERLLHEKHALFDNHAGKVYYCYGAWQSKFNDMQKRGIHFHQGIPERETIPKWFNSGGLLILDDLMDEGSSDKTVLDLFTKYSHHNNVTVLYLCQDMFPPGKYAKTISRNAHYVIAFKNPRDQLGVRNLALQAFPGDWEEVLKVYRDATNRPYGYLIFDLHPNSSDKQRLISNILDQEGFTTVYSKQP